VIFGWSRLIIVINIQDVYDHVYDYLYLHYFSVIKLDHSLDTYKITLLKTKKLSHLIVKFFENSQFLQT